MVINGYFLKVKILLFIVTSLGGCAINDMGCADLQIYENNTSYVAVLETWGISINTMQLDYGLIIGRSKRMYVYERPHAKTFDFKFLNELQKAGFGNIGLLNKSKSNDTFNYKESIPVAITRENFGLLFDANSVRAGIAIGVSLNHLIHLPSSFRGTFLYNYDSDNFEMTRIHIQHGGAL